MKTIIYFSFLFALSEFLLMIVKHSRQRTVKLRKDNGSMLLLWLMITTGFTCGFILAGQANKYLSSAGLLLIITGLLIRWISIIQLGSSFTVDVSVSDNAELKTDGIYGIVRHPSYLGILIIISGFALTMSSLLSFLVLVIPVTLAVFYRINVEENLLRSEFGEMYKKYQSRVKRIIPGVY